MTTTKRDLIEKLRGIDSGAAILLHRRLTEEMGEDEANRLWESAADALIDEKIERSDGPVHSFFGLTYSSYQVVPRVLAQSMPHEWQARFVTLMEEMQTAFAHLGDIDYEVTPAEDVYASELTEEQMKLTGITSEWSDEQDREIYWDRDGNEIPGYTHVMVPVPDPLPPYNRGRTRVPRADQLAQAGAAEPDEKRSFTMADYHEQI